MARTRIFENLVPGFFHPKQAAKGAVEEMWSNQGWNLSFRRPLNDWEIQRLVDFYKVLGQFKGITDAHDIWDGGITIKTISVSDELTRSLILVTVRGMGGDES